MVSVGGKKAARLAGYASVLAAAATLPMTMSAWAEAPTPQAALAQFAMQPAAMAALQPAVLQSSPEAAASPSYETMDADAAQPARELDAELVCMAKVVMHEAGGEPRAGKLAVAQLLLKRVKSGRFADSVCGVANQHGQFFNTSAYNPPRDGDRWASAVEVSLEAMAGTSADVVPGALFFASAAAPRSAFFRSRERVATIGRQVFYR